MHAVLTLIIHAVVETEASSLEAFRAHFQSKPMGDVWLEGLFLTFIY